MSKKRRAPAAPVPPPVVTKVERGESEAVAQAPALGRAEKLLISGFVLYHFMGIGLWLLPKNPFQQTFVVPFSHYMNLSGMWQSWSVFAPVPKTWNIYVSSKVHYADGTYTEFVFPRIDKLSYEERMGKERFRKYISEGLVDSKHAVIWPDTARWVLRTIGDRSKSPVYVDLIKHWAYIEKPETGINKPSPEPDQEYTFYRHRVTAGDLQ